jgi:hypothetical protein
MKILWLQNRQLKKGMHISRAGWFWLVAMVLTGISFSLWTNNAD